MKYTNTGLVNHAKAALKLKTKYMWGGILRPIEKQYDLLKSIYGNQSGTGYSAPRWAELYNLRYKGYYGVDCVGLVKSYYWSGNTNGGTGSPLYASNEYPDVPATTMFAKATKKGTIDTLPEIPGLILYCKNHPHVGIYIGNGYSIESTLGARGDGVVKRKVDSLWTHWFACPYIEYKTAATKRTNLQIANEVIQGKWGAGEDRKKKLAAAGYDPKQIQELVNEILKK